jgi:c-di-GMP-binding flagellar brake protein YcgR
VSWIPKGTVAPPSASVASPVRTIKAGGAQASSLELPIVMSVQRLPAPVYGTLMDITAYGATIRSLVLMERGSELEFDFGSGQDALTISARVESRRNAASGARFEYHLSFDTAAQAQTDALARRIREMERRTAASRSMQMSIDALPTTDRTQRGSFRALTDFGIRFREEGAAWVEGSVGDISGTGIRLRCTAPLQIGTLLELRFTLPSAPLDVYPEETAAIDLSQGAVRRMGARPDLRRPFQEMALKGRIVTRFLPALDREVYGVAFVEIDGYTREEIARFTHAVQLAKIRRS